MAIYTTCKNNTFNGMPLPDIWVCHPGGGLEKLRSFGYPDFKMRLGSKRRMIMYSRYSHLHQLEPFASRKQLPLIQEAKAAAKARKVK